MNSVDLLTRLAMTVVTLLGLTMTVLSMLGVGVLDLD